MGPGFRGAVVADRAVTCYLRAMRCGWKGISLVLALARASGALLRVQAGEAADLEPWKQSVRIRFPAVRQLTTTELDAWLHDTNRVSPVLLDVRTAAEFKVSHLPGAQRVDPQASVAQVWRSVPTNRPVVAYCSVGWRSSALVERLQKAGATNVMNLEGSIFAWANEARPLQRDGLVATNVHPYNATFGELLRPERRSPSPAPEIGGR